MTRRAVLRALAVLALGGPAAAARAQGLVRYQAIADASEVRYRVREQLVGLNFPNDAVGATRAIEGGIALDAHGRILPGESRFTVDLRTLRSDEPRRDNYLRRNTLETERYPMVVFVPTESRSLPVPLPATGTADFELIGDLTIRETTRRTTWQATVTLDGPGRDGAREDRLPLRRLRPAGPPRLGGPQRRGRHPPGGGPHAPAERLGLRTEEARRPRRTPSAPTRRGR